MRPLLPPPGAYLHRWKGEPGVLVDYLRVTWSSPPVRDYPFGWVSYLGTLTEYKPTTPGANLDRISSSSGGMHGINLVEAGWELVDEKHVPDVWRFWFESVSDWSSELEVLAWAATMKGVK